MRGALVPSLLIAALVLGGCGTLSPGSSQATAGPTRSAQATSSVVPSAAVPVGQKYQGVVLGPVSVPWAPKDQAARIFAQNPDLVRALETSVPASLSVRSDGGLLTVAMRVVGAVKRGDDIDVYANMWVQGWSIDRYQLVSGGGSITEATIRFRREGGQLRLTGVDRPGDGAMHESGLRQIMPVWAIERARLDERAQQPMEDALWRCASEWATAQMPTDLFVGQPAPTISDAHSHKPASERFKMLNPRYVAMKISRAVRPAAGDIEHGVASADGRFRVEYSLSGGVGTLLSDAETGVWYTLDAPGDSDVKLQDCVSFDPGWRGHTLFIDYSTVAGAPYRPTITHYEIDCDAMAVRRAVPMGPLSMNQEQ